MKMLMSLFLVICLLLTPFSTFAYSDQPQTSISANILDEYGNVIDTIEGTVVEASTLNSRGINEDGIAITYRFIVPNPSDDEYIDSDPHGPDETGYAAEVYTTIYHLYSSDGYGVLFTGAQLDWVMLDSQVSVSNAYAECHCTGPKLDRTGFITQSTTVSLQNHTKGATGFDKYILVQDGYGAFSAIGADFYIVFRMGASRTWSFKYQHQLY